MFKGIKTKIKNKVDVLIIGAGPVGLTLSNFLALKGIKGLCVDKLEDSYSFPRAISLDNDAVRILYQLGFSKKDFNFLPLKEVSFSSSFFGDLITLNTSGSIDTFPKLVSFFQPELEKKLKDKLLAYKNFQLLYNRTLKNYRYRGDHYEVSLVDEKGQNHEMSCLFLIGADGANSLVRKLEGLDFEVFRNYKDTWLILDTINKKPFAGENKVTFHCGYNRPCPSIPAPGGRQRFEFRLDSHKDIDTQLEKGPWKKFFYQRGVKENKGGAGFNNDFKVERKATYQFKACVAESFQKKGVFLVGDSAHLTPPFAGQGLVSGLKDAHNLSWKLEHSITGKLPVGVLKTYTLERKGQVKKVIWLAMVAGLLASPRTNVSSFLSQSFLFVISKLPLLKWFIRGFHFKPGNKIKAGCIMKKHPFGSPLIGKQFPSVWLRDSFDNHKKIRSDELLKGQFCLFCLNQDPLKIFRRDSLKQWEDWGGKVIVIHKRKNEKLKKNLSFLKTPYKEATWLDEEDKLSAFTGSSLNIFIVRPDFIIFNAGKGKGPLGGESLIKESLSFLKKN